MYNDVWDVLEPFTMNDKNERIRKWRNNFFNKKIVTLVFMWAMWVYLHGKKTELIFKEKIKNYILLIWENSLCGNP